MKPISLYIHIPFCKSKCHYCDFLSFPCQETFIEPYIEALLREIENYSKSFIDREVISIFLGGGTPSFIPSVYIKKIMTIIHENFSVSKDVEVTIECNPETLTIDKMKDYKDSGINRVSMGLQSADNKVLKKLGRIHTYETFLEKYNNFRTLGYDNINIDLMFGLPGQSLSEWMTTLNNIISLKPEHISIYGLIIEEGTPFYNAKQKKQLITPDEELERNMYWQANEILTQNNYKHYEISNYCKPGYECKHNKVYWTLDEYIGLGLGASSFYNNKRVENIRDLKYYIKANGDLQKSIATINMCTVKNQMEEWCFLGLRLLNEGINKNSFYDKFNVSFNSIYTETIEKLIKEDLITDEDNILKLTHNGIDISNYVLSHFLL